MILKANNVSSMSSTSSKKAPARAHLHRKLEKKLGEMSDQRKTKGKKDT